MMKINLLTLFGVLVKSILFITLLVLAFFCASNRMTAQEDVNVKVAKFSILVETTGDGVMLTCYEGCAWKELNFTCSLSGRAQAINQYGMTAWPLDASENGWESSKFIFTVARTPEGLSLEGIEGVIWTGLTFDCTDDKCYRVIDGWGVSDRK